MNPRKYSQIERALSILDKSGTTEILRDDQYLLFFFKKTERIVAALYIVTGLLSDTEPLKSEIREGGTQLIKNLLSFKERTQIHSKEFINEVLLTIVRIISLLDIAFITDLISAMNFALLKKELEGLTLIATEGRIKGGGAFASPMTFEERFFGVSRDLFTKVAVTSPEEDVTKDKEGFSYIGSLNEFERFKRVQKESDKGQHDIKDRVLNKEVSLSYPKRGEVSPIATPKRQVIRVVADKIKNERRQIIAELLHKKGSAMIRDFSGIITGCGEKTIQRILLGMVGEGVLKKEGERRWSRYSLVLKESL